MASVIVSPAELRNLVNNAAAVGSSINSAMPASHRPPPPRPAMSAPVTASVPAVPPATSSPDSASTTVAVGAASATVAGMFSWFNYKWAIGLLFAAGVLAYACYKVYEWWENRKKNNSPDDEVKSTEGTAALKNVSASSRAVAAGSKGAAATSGVVDGQRSKRDYSMVDEL
jgi:uncharacterized membrane protein YebE (DUF533 family)